MYDRILVPLDGSEVSAHGVAEATRLAQRLGSRLVLLHVVDDFPMMLEMSSAATFQQSLALMRERGEEVLAKARDSVLAAGVQAESVLQEVRQKTVADAIIAQVGKSDCSLVVMGTHGLRGFKRLAMGSDAELVLRQSPVPVLLVRGPAAQR